jgi:hypothetical protein
MQILKKAASRGGFFGLHCRCDHFEKKPPGSGGFFVGSVRSWVTA